MPVGEKHNPSVSVIILGWGGEKYITMCLNALSRQTYPAQEIIVVDNASPDRTGEIVERDFPQVRLLRTEKNLGVAGGNNVGLRAAHGEVLILTNVDTEARPDWIERLVQALHSDPAIGVVGSKLLYPDGTVQFGGGTIDPVQGFPGHVAAQTSDTADDVDMRDTDFVTGASLAIRRQVLEQIGLEDEAYYLIDFEDPDICYRARLAGWRVCYVPEAVSIHYESSTTRAHAPHRILSSLMGRLRFVCKFWPDEQLAGPFLAEETQWLAGLRAKGELGAFLCAVLPLIYFKTLLDLDDLIGWRERLGVSSGASSRQTLTIVLGRLREESLSGFQSLNLTTLPPTSPDTMSRLLAQWFQSGDNSLAGLGDNFVVQSMLSMSTQQAQVNPHVPIAWPYWPPGIWPKLVAAAQKVVRRLLRWYINPLIGQQNQVNTHLLQALNMTSQEIVLLRRQTADRERASQAELEALRQAVAELRRDR